jgi:hypothetical protein
MRGIAIVLGLLFAVPSQAGVSCAELNRMWAKKYHKDFDADWKLKSFRCPSEVSKIAEAFYELDHLQLKSAPGTLAPDFYEWVKSIVRETRYRETSEDHPTAVAFAGGGKMTLLESYTRQDLEWACSCTRPGTTRKTILAMWPAPRASTRAPSKVATPSSWEGRSRTREAASTTTSPSIGG